MHVIAHAHLHVSACARMKMMFMAGTQMRLYDITNFSNKTVCVEFQRTILTF